VTRAFVIVNTHAGGGRTRRLWPAVRSELARLGVTVEVAETSGPGAASALARSAAAAGWPLVVAVGGDGTLNEVAGGLADPPADVALGIVMTGRGRDACRNLGIAADPVAAARRLVDGEETRIDLGRVEPTGRPPRHFLAAAGAGFDAVVAERAAGVPGSGTVPYLAAVAASLLAHWPVAGAVEIDGAPVWTGTMTTAVVANGAHYGGGMRIAPGADPADGRLDVVVVGDLGRLELARWLPTVYRGGHLAHAAVRTWPARTVRIVATPPVPVHVDGETAGATPVTVRVRPGVLRLRR
jgi:YegS/Rv2252/BmrU family lipid kinase